MRTIPGIEGFECKQIRCFAKIYQKWINAVTDEAKQWKRAGDVPWWYGERASLSVFAGAIWLAGGHCLEEYSAKKRRIGTRTHRDGSRYLGRVDLHFSWHRYDFIAEAKAMWSGFTRGDESARAKLESRLKDAREAIGIVPHAGQRHLAILFARPYFKNGVETEINTLLQTWVKILAKLETSSYLIRRDRRESLPVSWGG